MEEKKKIIKEISDLSIEINNKLAIAMNSLGEQMRKSQSEGEKGKEYQDALKNLRLANKEASKGYKQLRELHRKLWNK